MSILPHTNENDHELNTSVSRFIKDYKISKLLHICRAEKEKGVPIINVFQYLLCLVFLIEVCICRLRRMLSKHHFPRILFTDFLTLRKQTGYALLHCFLKWW